MKIINTLLDRNGESHFDWPLLVLMYLISFFGVLCIAIARYDPAVESEYSVLQHILASRSGQMQCVWMLLSPFVIFIMVSIPVEIYKNSCSLIYFGVLFLLVITLALSKAVNGINSWLETGIGRAVQPCEFAKISVLLIMAKQFSKSEKPMNTLKDFMTVGLQVGIPAVVVLLQGETGSVIVIGAMFIVMTAFANVDWKLWWAMILAVSLGIAVIIGYAVITNSDDYRILRLLAFTDPQKYSESGGYQLLQSQKAIGAGKLTGNRLFRADSMSTLGFVPESSTDFIFSVVGEAFGFYGSAGLVLAYFLLILRLTILAHNTGDRFSRLIIYGVAGMFFFHVFENIAMNVGLMPITGIPLPFMSYGGSSYITNTACISLVLCAVKSRDFANAPGTAGKTGYKLSPRLQRSLRKPIPGGKGTAAK